MVGIQTLILRLDFVNAVVCNSPDTGTCDIFASHQLRMAGDVCATDRHWCDTDEPPAKTAEVSYLQQSWMRPRFERTRRPISKPFLPVPRYARSNPR